MRLGYYKSLLKETRTSEPIEIRRTFKDWSYEKKVNVILKLVSLIPSQFESFEYVFRIHFLNSFFMQM
jgi:hypothetical protein